MELNKKGILLFILSMVLFMACHKMDVSVENLPVESLSKFFDERTSSNPAVKAASNFIKAENNKYHFVDGIVKQLGYPYWKDAIAYKRLGDRVSTGSSGRKNSDSSNVVFIPFVREGEPEVNAALRVTMSAKDTSFRFLLDWQYSDTAATGMEKQDLALLLMVLHTNVFADTLFKLLDSTILEPQSDKRIKYLSINTVNLNPQPNVSSLLIAYEYTMTVCYTGYVPMYQGQVVGCAPGLGCPFYTQVSWCETISWTEWEDDGSGGGGDCSGCIPPGGGPGGGGWNPPDPCGGASEPIITVEGNEPCTPNPPGWEPVPIDDDLPPPPLCDDYILSLQVDANFAAQFATLNQPSVFAEGREKGIRVNSRATNSYGNKDGLIGEPSITWTFAAGEKIEGKMHSHFDGFNSIFSMGDILSMADMLMTGNMKDTLNYFEGMTSRNGGPFLMKISNITKFRKFAERMQDPKKRRDFLLNNAKIAYVDNRGKNLSEFMKIMENELRSSLAVYSGNANCTVWSRVTTATIPGGQGNISISETPCQ